MHARAAGFTLLEVLVALAVLALAMAALVRTTALQADGLADARDRTFARWVAANAIAEAHLANPAESRTEREGEMEMGATRWQWHMLASPTPAAGVRRLDVDVRDARGRHVLTLSGFEGAP